MHATTFQPQIYKGIVICKDSNKCTDGRHDHDDRLMSERESSQKTYNTANTQRQ